jgi:hypothetical protein
MVTAFQNGSVWKTLFIALITANLTGLAGWLMFGMDSVKHSEIDQIMATRAPYIHDKQRIDEHFKNLDERMKRLEDNDFTKR